MVFALPVDPFCAVFESLSGHLLGPGIPEPHLKMINLAGDIPQELIKIFWEACVKPKPGSDPDMGGGQNQLQILGGGIKINYSYLAAFP